MDMNTASASEGVGIAERVSDGLGPMQRWERDRDGALDEILVRVAEGERLKEVCRGKGWPYSVVAREMAGNEEWRKGYEGALRLAADDMAQAVVGIADGADAETLGKAKLQADVRLKLAGKLYRERYGEQVQHNVLVDSFGEMLRRVSDRKLAEIKAKQSPQLPQAPQPALPEVEINPIATPIPDGALLPAEELI